MMLVKPHGFMTSCSKDQTVHTEEGSTNGEVTGAGVSVCLLL
jgi:hypothetical protein